MSVRLLIPDPAILRRAEAVTPEERARKQALLTTVENIARVCSEQNLPYRKVPLLYPCEAFASLGGRVVAAQRPNVKVLAQCHRLVYYWECLSGGTPLHCAPEFDNILNLPLEGEAFLQNKADLLGAVLDRKKDAVERVKVPLNCANVVSFGDAAFLQEDEFLRLLAYLHHAKAIENSAVEAQIRAKKVDYPADDTQIRREMVYLGLVHGANSGVDSLESLSTMISQVCSGREKRNMLNFTNRFYEQHFLQHGLDHLDYCSKITREEIVFYLQRKQYLHDYLARKFGVSSSRLFLVPPLARFLRWSMLADPEHRRVFIADPVEASRALDRVRTRCDIPEEVLDSYQETARISGRTFQRRIAKVEMILRGAGVEVIRFPGAFSPSVNKTDNPGYNLPSFCFAHGFIVPGKPEGLILVEEPWAAAEDPEGLSHFREGARRLGRGLVRDLQEFMGRYFRKPRVEVIPSSPHPADPYSVVREGIGHFIAALPRHNGENPEEWEGRPPLPSPDLAPPVPSTSAVAQTDQNRVRLVSYNEARAPSEDKSSD